MLENFPLHRGHSAFTLLHSCRQVKQNLCMQESVMLLFSTWIKKRTLRFARHCSYTSPRQIGQVDSSGDFGLPSRDLDLRFLLIMNMKDSRDEAPLQFSPGLTP